MNAPLPDKADLRSVAIRSSFLESLPEESEAGAPGQAAQGRGREAFGMAPLIRFTLVLLYLALVLPLPLLAPADLKPILGLAVPLGLLLVLAMTSERVELDQDGIRVGYPGWCSWGIRRGWSLRWNQISGLTPVGTSQGGRVFYVRTRESGGAYLLPQRVQHFERFLALFAQASGVECRDVARLTPPWTYQLLGLLSAALLVGELLMAPAFIRAAGLMVLS